MLILLSLICKKTAPKTYEELYNTAVQHFSANEFEKAISLFKQVLEINPTIYKAYYNIGVCYQELRDTNRAIKYFHKTIQVNPNYTRAYQYLCTIFLQQKQFKKVEDMCRTILRLSKNNKMALHNMGYALNRQGKQQEAISYYKKVIELYPDFAPSHFEIARAYLATGNFKEGWHHFEWRIKQYKWNIHPKNYDHLKLEDIKNKIILIKSERGFGDCIQFLRYIPLLKKCGAKKIILTLFKPLVPLFKSCNSIDSIVTNKKEIPRHDIQIPIMSLPLIFETTYKTIPQNIPYLFANQKLTKQWEKILSEDKNFKIGLCWQSGPNPNLESNPLSRRSVPLEIFSDIADIENITFYSLQRFEGADQIYSTPAGFYVRTFGENFDTKNGSFMDTAAIMKNLDLVISVDTAVAHLAGALGINTWIILPCVAEWRWMQAIEHSPWYPTVKLFRQRKPQDYSYVIQKIKSEVKHLLSKGEANEK